MKNVTKDILYVGVNDHKVDLFEGQYIVPNGMAYNSYVILDEKIAVMDTVDQNFTHEWLDNIEKALDGKKPTYLIIQHMEPDHSANIVNFLNVYPDTIVVGNEKIFIMMEQFFRTEFKNRLVVKDMESLSLGKHTLTFVFAPMVHWPEVMVTYDSYDKVLFSADGFGKFGALDVEEEWDCEARRYYIGIVGKYGAQVQTLLKKAATLDIQIICPLHGPVLTENLGHYINLYDIWSSYRSETEGVAIFYTSVYGNTKKAVLELAEKLERNGVPKVVVNDLARCDMAECIEDAFRYPNIVLATTTYNAGIFPFMHTFLEGLKERNFQNKTIALIENGSWAPMAAKVMKDILKPCKNLVFLDPVVKIFSSPSEENREQIDKIVNKFTSAYAALDDAKPNQLDDKALFKLGYGLYVVTTGDGQKDNGCIINTVTQLTDKPLKVAVNINKANYSHHLAKETGKLNVNVLTEDAPFSVFETFGFKSGRNTDKFEGVEYKRANNGLVALTKNTNAVISLKVEQYVDLDTHGMFICSVTESVILSDKTSMTYDYYHKHVKPQPNAAKGWVCEICGFVYEGEEVPEDYICPLCKHGKEASRKI